VGTKSVNLKRIEGRSDQAVPAEGGRHRVSTGPGKTKPSSYFIGESLPNGNQFSV